MTGTKAGYSAQPGPLAAREGNTKSNPGLQVWEVTVEDAIMAPRPVFRVIFGVSANAREDDSSRLQPTKVKKREDCQAPV